MIVTACLLVIAASAAFIWYLCLRAPEGFEDQNGFHITAESEHAGKTANPMDASAIKPHDDHEPIAA